jgi:amino acid adenylation domain-containing protein
MREVIWKASMLLEKTETLGLENRLSTKKTVLDFFEDQIDLYAQQIAITEHDRTITYQELNQKANGLAQQLQICGVLPGTIVAIYLEPSIEFILSMLAILKAGAAYLPLDIETPEIRVEHILQDSKPIKIITSTHLATHLNKHKDSIIALNMQALDKVAVLEKIASRSSSDLLYVMYTSGSTGAPKGCMIPHRAVINLISNKKLIPYDKDARMAHISNAAFDAATFEIWGALLHKIGLFIFPRAKLLSIDAFSDFLQKERITILFLTTAYFNLIVHNKPECLDNLHYLLFGGEKSHPDITNLLLNRKQAGGLDHLHILHVYGPTENTTFSTQYRLKDNDHYKKTVPIGTPLANISLYVLDECYQEVPANELGELYLGGDNLSCGYLNDEKKTNEHFIVHPTTQEPLYKTGDFAYRDDHNVIHFVGRKDSQVKIRGNRVELSEIENTLAHYEFIDQIFVDIVSNPDEIVIVAYIIPVLKGVIRQTDFYYYLHKNLPNYMIPKKIYLIDKFPLNQNGKIDKEALRNMRLKTIFDAHETHLPANRIETIIATTFSTLLNETTLSTKHNFFDLGVNSLIVMEACAKLNQKINTNKKIDAIDFFTHPTIELLAQYISDNKENKELINCPNRASLQQNALLKKRHERT